MGKRKKGKRWTGKPPARSNATVSAPPQPGRRWLECAPALLGLGWLALIGCLDGQAESRAPERRTWTFSLREAGAVVMQSARSRDARVERAGPAETITISARPRLLQPSFHGYEPEGREKPAAQWGFTWALQRQGPRLTIRALGEERTRRCRYLLDELEIRLPAGYPLELHDPDP